MSQPNKTLRQLLSAIGLGQFNATMVIPYMMISPATTDPKASQVILLVQHIQRELYALGATSVPVSGYLDTQTAAALTDLMGPGWEGAPWSTVVQAVISARENGTRLQPIFLASEPYDPRSRPVSVGGPLDFLPDVPGGLVTYGVVGYLLYRHFTKRARP